MVVCFKLWQLQTDDHLYEQKEGCLAQISKSSRSVCSRTIHATVSLTGSESQPLHALPMFCIRLPPSVGIRWGIVCPAACSLFVFVLTGISSGGVSTWAKLADVEVIMTLKVLLSLARGVFPDLMCSVSWIRRTTSALGVRTYSMCGWRWKDGKMMWAFW